MPPSNDKPEFEKVPAHVAIIMDGNGRWAESRHLPRMAGHRAGTENLRNIIKACVEFGISYLTITPSPREPEATKMKWTGRCDHRRSNRTRTG